MKSHSKRILSLVFALLMLFQQVMFAAQTVDLFNPELGAKTVDLIPGEDDTNTVDLLTPSEEDSTKTVDLLNPEQPSATIEQKKPIIEKNENKTVDTITPRGDDIVPAEGKKSTTTIVVGGDEIEEGETNENSEISPEEIILPEENEKEEKKDASFEDEEHHENAGVLPWSTDLVKPWSIYRAPKTVYRPGEDLDLTELLVEIKTGRSGSLYNIEDLINDEFTIITRTRKSDGQKVRLDDKIYEDETMTIHMDGCQDLTIDFTVDENLKDEAKAFEAFQQNLIREEFRNGLDFSLYLIKKGEKENPVVAYSLDPHKLTPIGNGVDKKLKDGPLFDLKDINTWDRYDIETIGKVKAILERSAELKNTDNIRKKLITQLAIWNVTSNIIPKEIDATVSEPTEIAPELKPAEEIKENPEEDKKDEPIEITEPTTPEEETENIEKEDEKVEDTKDETVEIKTEEKVEEKVEAEESEKIEEKAPVQSTVHKIVFNAKEIDVPYDDIELSDEEYELYKELTSLEAVELKNEDENLKIYEPIIIEETENQYADLVTIGATDIESIERVATEVTFDAVDYSFQNLYHTLETSSMLGFGQPRDFNVLLKATMKASRKIVKGDKFEVEILSKTLPILNGEEGRANDIQLDGKVVATAEYIAEEHKIVYTFVEDLDTDKVEIEQEFKQIKEEKAALLNMLEVSDNLVQGAVRGAEGAEGNPEELEISPEDENATIKLVLGNTPVQYNGYSFETKKFRLKTTMTAKAFPIWQIPVGWTFDVNIGPYLKPDPNYPLKNLYNPDDPKEKIAEPKYNPDTNTITYKYVKSLSSTKTLDIDQYLAFNIDKIGDKDKIDINISVEPKNNPKQQMPTKTVYRDDRSPVITSAFEVEFDENGEPNLNNQYKFFEYGENYRVTFDAKSTPIIEDRKMTAIDWEITFDANGRKLSDEDLKLITNFTAVENSGIKNIDNVKLNGQPLTNLEPNFSNEFLINDSKNVVGKQSSDKYVFTFRTPVERQQQAYILDIAAKLGKVNRTGAVRLIQPYIDGVDLAYESPTVLKYSNRVTNKGEFLSEDQIRWTLTEEVSSGDDGILPLVTRTLSKNQQIDSFKVSYYILNGNGKMAKVGETKNINSKEIEQGKLDGEKKFAPGTIAVYEIITNIDSKDDNQGNVYSFGDNRISLYRNVDLNIKWSVQEAGKDNLPEETLTLTSEDGKHTTSKTIKPEENEKINPAGKNVQIENVKRWEFVNGELKEIKYNLAQKLPNEEKVNDGTIYYKEVINSFNIYDKRYEILNTIFKGKDIKTANIKIIKKDSIDNKLLLQGARFSLIGDGSSNMEYSGVTDYNGEVTFNNVTPGVYILQEDSAPDGYKRHNTTDTVTVDENGRVTWTNNIIVTENYKTSLENKNGKLTTNVLYRNGSPIKWPSFMNALSYATIDGDDVNYYVFLKPDYNTKGTGGTADGTNQVTKFFVSFSNVKGIARENIKLYDVEPKKKNEIKEAFLNNTIDNYINSKKAVVCTDPLNDYNIVQNTNFTEDFLGKRGYNFDIPKARFNNDWGFIVKYTGKIIDVNKETSFCYDWIQLYNKSSNDRILDARTTIHGLNDRVVNSNNEARNPILVVNNTAKNRFPIIVNTRDDKRKIVGGAEFTLTEKNTNKIVDIKTTDSNGRCEFRDIPEGEYILKETKSPTGLSKYNLTYNVTITPGGQVLYSAVDENGNEVDPGDKYTIGTVEVDDNNPGVGTKTIKVLSHSMTLNETSGWGTRRGVWEEAKYEAYDFKASFMLNNTEPGDKIVIDFDDNWNMTQWSGDMPNIVTKDGQIVARPQLDTEKNILTYTLTDYVKGKTNINASLLIQSIRPSKYYVKVDKNDDGSPIIYKFLDTITTLPGAAEQSKVEQVTYVEPDLGPYFGTKGDREPLYITQNVDITTKNSGNLELRNVTVFNPEGKKNVTGDRQLKIFYGMTTDPNVTEMGNKIEPPYKPTRVVVYKVDNPNKYNLPVTGGIKPSEDSNTYKQIANFNIVYNTTKVETQNGVTLNYNENRVNISRNIVPTLNNNTNVQFMITLPPTSKGEGYVVEQFYDVTDEDTFRDNYSMTSVYYTGAWGRSGGISQMKPKKNSGTANSGKVVDVPEINHDLTVYHYKSIGNFIVKKADENGKPLNGAIFTLIDGKGTVVDEVTVGEGGIGKFNNVPSGKYVLEETKAPDGYKATDRTIDVTVGDNGVISFDGVENNDKVFKLIDSKNPTIQVTNKPIKTKVTIVKVDEDNPEQKLSGAVFKLFDENGKEVKRDDKPYTVTTGKDGKATFKDLEPGTYTIKEIKAPEGYKTTDGAITVKIDKDGKVTFEGLDDIFKTLNDTENPTIQVTNKPNKTKVTIVKVDEEDPTKILRGAVFKLLDKDGNDILRNNQPYTVTTGTDGKATFEDLEPGTYIIKEIKAPNGYELTNKTWKVVVGEYKTVKVYEQINMFELNYTISNPGLPITVNYDDKPSLSIIPSIVKNNDGKLIGKLDIESKYVTDDRELGFPLIFKLDNKNFKFKYKGEEKNEIDWAKYPISNYYGKQSFEFEIIPQNGIKSGEYQPITEVIIGKGRTSNKLPVLEVSPKPEPQQGGGENNSNEYRIIAANGLCYIWNNQNEQDVAEIQSVIGEIPYTNSYYINVIINRMYYTNLTGTTIINFNTDLFEVSPITKNISVSNEGQSKFDIDFYGRLGIYTVQYKITPKQGVSSKVLQPIKSMYCGGAPVSERNGNTLYLSYLENIGAPTPDPNPNPNPNPEPNPPAPNPEPTPDPTKPKEVTDETPNDNEFTFTVTNKQKLYEVEFDKISSNKDKKGQLIHLSGAQFKLMKKEKINDSEEFVEYKTENQIESDSNGKISIKGLKCGEYKLFETKAPDGYELVPVAVKHFEITKDGDVFVYDNGKKEKLDENSKKIVNHPKEKGKITIYKTDSHGSPLSKAIFGLFIGKVLKYDNNENNDGTISFTNLEPGIYILREIKAPDGYDKTNRTWTVTVYSTGDTSIKENPFSNEEENNSNRDVSNLFDVTAYSFHRMGDKSKKDKNIYPNCSQFFEIAYKLKYKKDKLDIKEGDYFETQYSKYISRPGTIIGYQPENIYLNGELLAVATYKERTDPEQGDIVRYTFTKYVEGLTKDLEIQISEALNVNREAIPNTTTVNFVNNICGTKKEDKGYNINYQVYKFGVGDVPANAFYDYRPITDGNIGMSSFINTINYINGKVTLLSYIDSRNINPNNYKIRLYSNEGAVINNDSSRINIYKLSTAPSQSFSRNIQKTKLDTKLDNGKFSVQYGINEAFVKINDSSKAYYVIELETDFDKSAKMVQITNYVTDYKNYGMGTMAKTIIKEIENLAHGNISNPNVTIKNYKKPDIEFQKVDGKDKTVKLEGAKFTLYKAKKGTDGKYEIVNGALKFGMVDNKFDIIPNVDKEGNPVQEDPEKGYTVTSGEEGKFKFVKLEDGIYAVKETKAPVGYTKLLDYVFYFKVEGGKITEVDKFGKVVLVDDKGEKVEEGGKEHVVVDITLDKPINNVTEIENFKVEYPATGGVGALPFVFIGMMIMMAGAYMFIRRRDALYE